MKIKIDISKERMQFWSVFVVTMLVCLMPLFSVNCIQGHDLEYHLLRIESLKEGILMGLPFLKINVLFFGGRGYASSMFYPDFLLYIPALLRCMGVSINLSYHIFVALTFVAAYFSMYYCTKEITDNKLMAMAAAVIYSLAQYHLDDIYTRAAVGEFSAYIFIPFLLYGIYEMLYGRMRKPYLLIIGFCGVILSHTITTIMFIAVFFVAFILSAKKMFGNIKQFLTLVLSALIVIGLTAFYWLPVIEQLFSASFRGAAEFDLNYEKLMLSDLFINKNPAIGVALFLPLLLRIFLTNKSNRIRFADFCMIIGLIAGVCATGILPWSRLQGILGFIQFPWRSFMLSTPLLAIADSIYIFESIADKQKLVLVGVLALFSIFAVNTYARLDQGYYSYSNDYYAYDKFTGNVIGGEWVPSSVDDIGKLTEDCDTAVTENGKIAVNRYKNTLTFIADGAEYADVPFLYYKGYVAMDEVGNELVVSGEGKNGMCRVLTNGLNNIAVTVKYRITTLQLISYIISLVSFAGLLVLYIKRRD